MQEVSTATPSEAMTLRLAVAKFMGLVVGEALAVKYEGNWIIIERKHYGNESMQPIYVRHCHCEPGDDSLDMEGYAPQLLNHWVSCLAVVPDYANDDAAAVRVLNKFKSWSVCSCIKQGEPMVWVQARAASVMYPTFAEAVCRAAIAYAKSLEPPKTI